VKVLATYNIKGGVGKTSTAVNLAYLAAREGRRTLLWDLDPQAAATYLFRVRPRVKGGGHALVTRQRPIEAALKATDFDNLDLLPADFSYRNMDLELDDTKKRTRRLGQLLDNVAGEYDVVFLDCPPSISLVSENVMHASDTLLVPLIPATLSMRTLDQLTRFVADSQGSRPEVVAFFSMADRRKRLHREVIDAMARDRTRVADTVIPALSIIEQMAERRAPVPAFAPTSRAAQCYEQLWAEVCPRKRPWMHVFCSPDGDGEVCHLFTVTLHRDYADIFQALAMKRRKGATNGERQRDHQAQRTEVPKGQGADDQDLCQLPFDCYRGAGSDAPCRHTTAGVEYLLRGCRGGHRGQPPADLPAMGGCRVSTT
jgi:cellulose biosynthesis protein BcsQ